MAIGGKFKIDVSRGGYPVWCTLFYEGKEITRLHHSDLRDLRYAAKQAMREARQQLRKGSPSEPEKYLNEV
jgi:hypothetical protein